MILSQRTLAIAASVLLSTVLGSIHAFSVFIPQWEALFGANRANVSLIYSTALVVLTLAVLFGHRLYGSLAPVILFLLAGVIASTGLFISASSQSLILLYLSYGVLFGGANGLGYGYALQLAGQAAPANRGLAMGLVTAFYAVGATISPKVLVLLIEHGGNSLALHVMSAVILVVAFLAAVLVKQSAIQFESEVAEQSVALTSELNRTRSRLWIAYGSAVAAGLMVIGHSYSIAVWANIGTASAASAAWAVTVVALGNMTGGFWVVYYADKLSSKSLLKWLPVLSTFGLIMVILSLDFGLVIVFSSLAAIGFSYGAIIAVYPVAVADIFGALASPRIYGQVFTAWGVAGLLGPWASGWLFDITGSYAVALLIAAALSALSAAVIWRSAID